MHGARDSSESVADQQQGTQPNGRPPHEDEVFRIAPADQFNPEGYPKWLLIILKCEAQVKAQGVENADPFAYIDWLLLEEGSVMTSLHKVMLLPFNEG